MGDDERMLRAQGIVTTSGLIRSGMSERRIAAAIRDGRLRRLRRGWFSLEGANPRIAAAVAAGGRLACVSALASRGVWILNEHGLHVSVPRGTRPRVGPDLHVHHGAVISVATPGAVESAAEALERTWRCCTPIETLIAVDSALEQGVVSTREVESIFERSRRRRWVLDRADGRSQSGTETIARAALRGRGVRIRPQVTIAGVGRVDLLIGDRLVLEVDSVEWHSSRAAFEEDRLRDLRLTVLGYLVVRVTYSRVIGDWAGVEQQLLALIRRDEHLWRSGSLAANVIGIGTPNRG